MSFFLDERLERGKFLVGDLPLCRVLLNDDSRFPWLVLVPCVADVCEIYQLSYEMQATLIGEISSVSKVLCDYVGADKMNIASFGNVVSQLHIHIVARFKTDPVWPDSVIGIKGSVSYNFEQRNKIIADLKRLLLF